MTRNEIARQAFYGNNPFLMEYLNEITGYEQDGCFWPNNGMTLAECIALVEALDADTLTLFA